MKYILTALILAAVIHGCGSDIDPSQSSATSSGAGGAGGGDIAASVSSSSSSSSSGGGSPSCTAEQVASVCDECKSVGCPMADPKDPDMCHYVGVVHYADMVGCAQQTGPQALCEACKGIAAGMPLTDECASCAQPLTSCSFDCMFEASGGTK